MTKKILLIGIALLVFGCGQEKGRYYFDFDQVDHYSIDVDENILFEFLDKKKLDENQQLKIDIVLNDKPKKLSDSLFISKLPKIGFTKHKVQKENLKAINEIFREKEHKEVYGTACIAVYRDILVFKKSDSIVGIAKICFECSKNQIVGTDVDTRKFGQSGDYGMLRQLLPTATAN